MNKLISKNPILRFKLGRKIVKAQFGWHVREDGVVVNRFGVPVKAAGKGYRPHSMTQDDSYQKEYPLDKLIAPGLYKEYGTNDIYASRMETDNGEAVATLIAKAPNQNFSMPKWKNNSKQQKSNSSKVDTSFLTNDLTLRLLDASANPVKKVSNASRNPGAYHNITTWQNKLKDFYAPGTFKVDGIWGDNTEAAYLKYLQLVNAPEMSLEEAKIATAPRQVQFVNPVNLNAAPIQAPQLTYNKTQVREFLRNKGVNPYSFTGDQRRALRMVLNGQGTDEDKALIQSMGIFKKGGQLPSRNPITRFRNRKSN